MKTKKIIKILVLICSIITIFSCSHKNNNYNKNISITETNFKKNKKDLVNISHMQLLLQNLYKKNIIYFNYNKSYINPIFFKSLNYIANFLSNHKNVKICIEGYTNDSSSNKFNFMLSKNRIKKIKLYLIKRGVLNKQISYITYGKEKSFMECSTESCYVKNRRAVIIIY